MNLGQGLHRFHVGDRLSEIAVHNGTVYLAGQVPDDASQDIGGQTTQVLAAIDRLLAEVVSKVDMKVEISGGIRDDETLKRALDSGARRVNIGTAALENPEWCDRICGEYGDRVAIGLDVKGGRLAARGWTREGGELFETLERLERAGCERYVVTDVNSDGMLSGPNLDLLRSVCEATDKPVIASGGVSSLDDLRALAGLTGIGVEGAIVGTALYERNFTVAEALNLLKGL